MCFLSSAKPTLIKVIFPIIIEHLSSLENIMGIYFPSITMHEFDGIRNPFVNLTNPPNSELCEEEKLSSLSSDHMHLK